MSASREPQINLKELPGVRGERGPAVAVRRPGLFTAAASRRPTGGSSHGWHHGWHHRWHHRRTQGPPRGFAGPAVCGRTSPGGSPPHDRDGSVVRTSGRGDSACEPRSQVDDRARPGPAAHSWLTVQRVAKDPLRAARQDAAGARTGACAGTGAAVSTGEVGARSSPSSPRQPSWPAPSRSDSEPARLPTSSPPCPTSCRQPCSAQPCWRPGARPVARSEPQIRGKGRLGSPRGRCCGRARRPGIEGFLTPT